MSLSQDLALIRNDLKINLEELHSLSKMPVDILESIENGGIFTDEERNMTYKRSFVRTYAKVLKINDADISRALDLEFDGTYDGFLAKKYLGRTMEELNKPQTRRSIIDHVSTEPAVPVQNQQSASPKNEKEAVVEPKEIETKAEVKPEIIKTERVVEKTVTTTPLRKVSSEQGAPPQPDPSPYNKTQTPPTVQSVNWAEVGTSTINFKNAPRLIAGILALVIVLSFGYWLVTSDFFTSKPTSTVDEAISSTNTVTENPTNTEQESAAIISDTLQVEVAQEVVNEPVVAKLTDTLAIVVVAATDNLEPVRVKTDLTGSYFPYWVEKGQGMRFQFTDSISIRGQYNRMILMLNDKPVEALKDNRGKSREIVITRGLLQSNPDWLTPLSEEEAAKVVKPTKIVDRPVFN